MEGMMVTNEDDWQNSNLTRLFDKATSLYENLESSSSSPNDNSKCLLILEECQRRIMTLGLFSSNETIEDLQTSSIRYLLVEYYLGRLYSTVSHHPSQDLSDRLSQLERSKAQLENYLEMVKLYLLLDKDTLELTKPINDSRLPSRDIKIGRMRIMNSLKTLIKDSSLLVADSEEEMIERERWICIIRLRAIESIGELEILQDEIKLLQNRLSSDQNCSDTGEKLKSSFTSPENTSKVLQPFILVKDRQQVKQKVFKPGHSLPTMTIDEYLELERAKGGILPPSEKTLPSDYHKDIDKDEVIDLQTKKDRLFDTFKDENPRGWGNTHNLS